MAGLDDVAGKRVGGFSLGMGQRLGIASALLGDPGVLVLDEPVNGLDPEGVLWIRNLLKGLAAEGRTVFVSSHLMSEMALTATRLVVVGRGRLIADTTVEEFVARAGSGAVTVRTPQAAQLRDLLLGPDITVTSEQGGVLQVRGLTAEEIGTTAWQARLPIFELTTTQASLEEAFMQLTDDSVDFPLARGPRGGGSPMSALTTTPAAAGPALKVTQGRVLRSEFTKFRSLRSTAYTLLTAVVLMVGLGAVFAAVTASQYHTFNAAARASFNPITTSLGGVMFAVVAFGVLGVLVASGEYSTGMIRASLTAVPRRLPVLWGKLAVFAAA